MEVIWEDSFVGDNVANSEKDASTFNPTALQHHVPQCFSVFQHL